MISGMLGGGISGETESRLALEEESLVTIEFLGGGDFLGWRSSLY